MIINTLKLLMNEDEINQTRISESTGITRPTLLSLIRNENKSIRYDVIEELCKFFDIRLESFLIYTPVNIEILNFKYYIKEQDKKENIVDLEIFSEVRLDNETYLFTHTISDFKNNNFSKYYLDLVTYAEYKKSNFYIENRVNQVLNILFQLRDDYLQILYEMNTLLNNGSHKSSMTLNIGYSIQSKPTEDDIDSIMVKIKNMNNTQKDMIKNMLELEEIEEQNNKLNYVDRKK